MISASFTYGGGHVSYRYARDGEGQAPWPVERLRVPPRPPRPFYSLSEFRYASRLRSTYDLGELYIGRRALSFCRRARSSASSLYLPCTFPVPSLYLPCTFAVPSLYALLQSLPLALEAERAPAHTIPAVPPPHLQLLQPLLVRRDHDSHSISATST